MLGPNGVGKSTLFNLIIGLLKPDFGSIIVNGENVLDYPIYQKEQKNLKLAMFLNMVDIFMTLLY